MTEKISLGQFIYDRRKALGLTQSELADKLSISNKAVSKWETFEANPDLSLIPKLAKVLGVSTDELLACKVTDKPEVKQYENYETDGFITKYLKRKGTVVKTDTSYEFVSNKKTKKGTPYIHINLGKKDGKICKAKGIFAIGLKAQGIISVGLLSIGILSTGLLSIGILSVGMLALGLAAIGGILAIGGVAVAPVAIGVIAVGAIAIGVLSVGAISIGIWAHTGEGGIAKGIHVIIHKNSGR